MNGTLGSRDTLGLPAIDETGVVAIVPAKDSASVGETVDALLGTGRVDAVVAQCRQEGGDSQGMGRLNLAVARDGIEDFVVGVAGQGRRRVAAKRIDQPASDRGMHLLVVRLALHPEFAGDVILQEFTLLRSGPD